MVTWNILSYSSVSQIPGFKPVGPLIQADPGFKHKPESSLYALLSIAGISQSASITISGNSSSLVQWVLYHYRRVASNQVITSTVHRNPAVSHN
jgi:hypothetical protein